MADIDSINNVEADSIAKINGIEVENISEIGPADFPAGGGATRWLIGASGGRLYMNDSPPGMFLSASASGAIGLVVDKGSMNFYGVAYGNDENSQPRWIAHSDDVSNDIFYISASQDPNTSGNWTKVNVTNGKTAKRGGPGITFGNGKWFAVGGGRNLGSNNRLLMMSSSDGGNSWEEVNQASLIGTSNNGYAVNYVSASAWWSPMGVTKFYQTTNARTWASASGEISGYEAYAMGYNKDQGTYGRWIVGTNSGKLYYSDDNFATDPTEAVSPFGSSNVWGVIYAGGSINKWIAIASNGKIAYSTLGSAFTASTLPSPIGSSHHMRGIASDNLIAVVVGATNGGNNCILSSSNGTSWTYVSSLAMGNVNFESIACNIIGHPGN